MSSKIEDEFEVLDYRDFSIMVWKPHPAAKKADFDLIANSMHDYRQVVIEAAQFMYENESYVYAYAVTIQPRHYDFEIHVSFHSSKVKEELFRKKRIVEVRLKSIKVPSAKDYLVSVCEDFGLGIISFQMRRPMVSPHPQIPAADMNKCVYGS